MNLTNAINAITSGAVAIMPLINVQINYYFNISAILFGLGSSFNHLYPSKYDKSEFVVKSLHTHLCSSLIMTVPNKITLLVSIIDLAPLYFNSTFIYNKSSKILILRVITSLQIVAIFYRRAQIVKAILLFARINSFLKTNILVGSYLLCNIIYFFERKYRIIKGIRTSYGWFHNFAHIGDIILIYNLLN